MRTVRAITDPMPTERVGRYPKHTFQTKELPFTLQPISIAPVLPGETMTNLYMESRCVTDPIENPLIGWKKEYFYFYVKLTDIIISAGEAAAMTNPWLDMLVDPDNVDLTVADGAVANSTPYYTAKGSIRWLYYATKRVTDTWFRDAGEVMADYVTADGLPIVQVKQDSWLDSITDKDDLDEGDAIAGATDAADLNRLMLAWEHARAMGLLDMDYNDYLRAHGISVPDSEEDRPELLARFGDFQYPSNTIDPATGTPSSAVSWVFKNGERKPKFFREPGFVVGFSVTRPKIYLSGLAGNMAGYMSRAWDWLPRMLNNMPETSLKQFAADTGPVGDITTPTDAYWIDMRDLLLYGDQFQNVKDFNVVPAADGDFHMFPLPDAAFNTKYLSEANIKELFVTPASSYFVRQDGYVSLGVKGHQADNTPGNLALA